MEKYTRTDFAQVGTTNRGCMKVVPGEKKSEMDKIAVGGQNGSVICLARKLNDTQILFKTEPGPEIEAVKMGGALGSVKNKIFVAADTSVRGMGKKGKPFFTLDSNMAEIVRRMTVYGVNLVLTGRKSYNHYHDGADTNYYLCPEDIIDVVSLINEEAWGERPYTSVLACADSTLRVIEGSISAYEIRLEDIPYTLNLYMEDGGFSKKHVLYGTKAGKLGLVHVPKGGGNIVWELQTKTSAAITSIVCYPMTGSQYPDIIIGKEDGYIEMYTVDETDKATFYGSYMCDESITSLSCGHVTTKEQPEIIVCTFTGWLFSLARINKAHLETLPQAANFSVKVQQLKSEVDELKSKVQEERQRYLEMTERSGSSSIYMPNFQIHDKFEFNPELGTYDLTIELVLAIDFIMIQSHLPLKLLEVERNTAVVSELQKDELFNPWPLLATYRCQANMCRMEIRVQANEGDAGILNVYIVPKIHPSVSQIVSYVIKALSSHVRVHDFDLSRPITTLSFTGQFTISEAHAWLHHLLPDVPLKCPPADNVTNNFNCAKNGGTQLQITYSKGSAVFRSDCLTTIAIIRDKVTEETMSKQIRVEVECDLNENSVEHCLKLLDPKMTYLTSLEKQKMYAMALKELESNNDDVFDFLSESNAEILKNHDRIFEESQKTNVESFGIIPIYENLLVAKAKLSGKLVGEKLEALRNLLKDDYSLERVVDFFKNAFD